MFIRCGDGKCIDYNTTWQNCIPDCNDGIDETCWPNEVLCDGNKITSKINFATFAQLITTIRVKVANAFPEQMQNLFATHPLSNSHLVQNRLSIGIQLQLHKWLACRHPLQPQQQPVRLVPFQQQCPQVKK